MFLSLVKLFSLKLNNNTTLSTFLSDWQKVVAKLCRLSWAVASDDTIMRALLLVAIQHKDFEAACKYIANNPGKKPEKFVRKICKRMLLIKTITLAINMAATLPWVSKHPKSASTKLQEACVP